MMLRSSSPRHSQQALTRTRPLYYGELIHAFLEFKTALKIFMRTYDNTVIGSQTMFLSFMNFFGRGVVQLIFDLFYSNKGFFESLWSSE